MAEANDEDLAPSLPRRGKVQAVREQWSVHEDGALAYKMQNEEISHHYGLNRFNRRTVREDIPVAKIVQTEEEVRQQEERMRQLEALKAQAEEDEIVARRINDQIKKDEQRKEVHQHVDDEEIARQLQEKEKKRYERHLEKKKGKKLKQERQRIESELARDIEEAGLAVKSGIRKKKRQKTGSDDVANSMESLNMQGVNNTRVTPGGRIEDDGDFSDFYNLPSEMDEFTRLEIQACQDEELARLLQEQEHKRTKAEVDRDKLKRIEQQDEELAKVMQEQEKVRLRKAKLKHQQKKELQRQKAAESLPLGASANSMNLQQQAEWQAASVSARGAATSKSYQQHSPHSTSSAIPMRGGGENQQHRYRRNSYTQAFDSPPSPPRSQPPPRPAPNKNRHDQKPQAASSFSSSVLQSSSSIPHSHSPPPSSSHLASSNSSYKNPSTRPPMPIPSNNSSGMSTLESARRIAAGDHEGILAAQNSVVSSPRLTGVTTLRDGSNVDVVRSSGHSKLSSSHSIGSGSPVDPPVRKISAGLPHHHSSDMPYESGVLTNSYGGSVGRAAGSGALADHWRSGSYSYSDEDEEDIGQTNASPYLNGSSGFNIAAAIDPTYQRRHPEASRYPPDETQVKTVVPFTRSLPQADGEVEWDPGLRGSLRKTKAPTYGYQDSTASNSMSCGDPGWQPIQGQRRSDHKSKKSAKKQNSVAANEGKKDKNSNCKQQ